ncbi:hypothetical protein D3C87_1147450 [compost metagenome]
MRRLALELTGEALRLLEVHVVGEGQVHVGGLAIRAQEEIPQQGVLGQSRVQVAVEHEVFGRPHAATQVHGTRHLGHARILRELSRVGKQCRHGPEAQRLVMLLGFQDQVDGRNHPTLAHFHQGVVALLVFQALGKPAPRREAQLDGRRRPAKRHQQQERGQSERDGPLHDPLRPAPPRLLLAGQSREFQPTRRIHAGAKNTQEGGKQRKGEGDGANHDDEAAPADGTGIQDRSGHQACKANQDREAREQHRDTRRRYRLLDCLGCLQPPSERVTETVDHQERVVDAHGETQHGRDALSKRRELDVAGHEVEQALGEHDGEGPHDQGDARGHQGTEGQEQHQNGQRHAAHLGATGVLAAELVDVVGQRSPAGDVPGEGRILEFGRFTRGLDRLADGRYGFLGPPDVPGREPHEGEGLAPVVRQEADVIGLGVGGDVRDLRMDPEAGHGVLQETLEGRIVHGLALALGDQDQYL